MKGQKIWWVSVLCLAAVLVLILASVAVAASVTPTEVTHSNTPHNEDLRFTASDTKDIPGHPGMHIVVTVSVHSPQGQELAFTSDVPVLKVYMKGGDNYNIYDYSAAPALSDTGLICPLNDGGNVPDLSHADFYFGDPVTTTALPTTSSSTTTTTTAVVDDVSSSSSSSTTTTSTTAAVVDDVTTAPSTPTTAAPPTAGAIQAGGGGAAGPSGGAWALGVLALALLGGVGYTRLAPALKRK